MAVKFIIYSLSCLIRRGLFKVPWSFCLVSVPGWCWHSCNIHKNQVAPVVQGFLLLQAYLQTKMFRFYCTSFSATSQTLSARFSSVTWPPRKSNTRRPRISRVTSWTWRSFYTNSFRSSLTFLALITFLNK
jgi:hypothetical protein